MESFLSIINEIHESIKGGARETLAIDVITEEYLLNTGITKKTNGVVTYLDTSKIGANYLMLWNHHLILSLRNLEHLVLSNLELRELDLSTLTNLKVIELQSFNRDAILYIAENSRLQKLDISNLVLNGDNVSPIALYAHPNQVGLIFPANIESKCRDKDDYLVITLHLAPPKHRLIEANDLPLKYLQRFKEAELGIILKLYWESQPEYYTKYSSLDDAAEHEKEVFSLLLEVEKRVASEYFESKRVRFDPNTDINYPILADRDFGKGRIIPSCMFQEL